MGCRREDEFERPELRFVRRARGRFFGLSLSLSFDSGLEGVDRRLAGLLALKLSLLSRGEFVKFLTELKMEPMFGNPTSSVPRMTLAVSDGGVGGASSN